MQAKFLLGGNQTDPLKRQLNEILSGIGFGDGKHAQKAGNLAGNAFQVTFTQANQNVTIFHKLGHTPTTIFPTHPSDKAGASIHIISKNNKSVTLGCNVAGASFTIYVE